MADERGKVAEGYVEITADTSKLKAGLGEAKAETQAFVKETEVASEKVGETADKAGSLRDAMSGVRAVMRTILLPVALASQFVRLLAHLDAAASKADAMRAKFAEMSAEAARSLLVISSAQTESMEALDKQIENVRSSATAARGALTSALLDETKALAARNAWQRLVDAVSGAPTIDDAFDRQSDALAVLTQQERMAVERLERRREQLLAERLRREVEATDELVTNRLEGEEKVRAVLSVEEKRLLDRIAAETDGKLRDELRYRLRVIREHAAADLERIRQREQDELAADARRIAERERAEYEAFERQQQRMAEAAERSAQSFARAMEQAFRSVDMANTIRQGTGPLLAELRDVALQLKINSMTGGRS